MKEAAAALNRRRTLVLAANLGYFLALAALGFFLFFRSRSAAVYVTALAALAVYLLLIRPMTERYKAALRGEILRNGVCGGFTDVTYAPREGFKAADFLESGLVNTLSEKAFLSRERSPAAGASFGWKWRTSPFPSGRTASTTSAAACTSA